MIMAIRENKIRNSAFIKYVLLSLERLEKYLAINVNIIEAYPVVETVDNIVQISMAQIQILGFFLARHSIMNATLRI